ncbi:uncharacterized protein CEXT_357531 [Caerostris extrusa]|uniref:Uncharacterized protein n=1 Tax=Caerostris extrusa TaxID=172846 RepID=A0AAV4U4B5_CAEEX|nr:uncharacterized protein CEXT_357531 [Caerostris extrusa]
MDIKYKESGLLVLVRCLISSNKCAYQINNAEITGFTAVEEYIDDSICQVQTEEFIQEKELNTHILKEELWEVQKTIHEKELNILKSGPQYIEVPYKQKYDLKMGNTVPTSIDLGHLRHWKIFPLSHQRLSPTRFIENFTIHTSLQSEPIPEV